MKLIQETPGLESAIRRVVDSAFGGPDEGELVDALRRDGDLVISLVAECGGSVCGYVALSRLQSPPRALALAPVAVTKAEQGRGIGSALIRRAVELAEERCYAIIFVLGEPDYYRRFGFSVEAAKAFPCKYAGPYFMALQLEPDVCPIAPVRYADAFGSLD